MNPTHDIVLSLLEAPFSRRSEVEKRQILQSRPTPKLTAIFSEKSVGRETSRTFQTSWYESYKWLCGSSYKQSLYCWPCILLGKAKNSWCSRFSVKLFVMYLKIYTFFEYVFKCYTFYSKFDNRYYKETCIITKNCFY